MTGVGYLNKTSLLVFSVFCFCSVANAQLLATTDAYAPKKEEQQPTIQPRPSLPDDDVMRLVGQSFVGGSKQNVDALKESKGVVESDKNGLLEDSTKEDVFIPEGELSRLNAPTTDGSERGGQAFVEVDEKGRMKKAEKIFLFYDNFKVTDFLSKTATCDVRFNILSNLDQKIVKLDVKLVWPDMTTTLSFSNVNPNTQTYYNYSLLGNGCYSMDKAPNIVVNRCRVRGMTAAECANKLVWLTK